MEVHLDFQSTCSPRGLSVHLQSTTNTAVFFAAALSKRAIIAAGEGGERECVLFIGTQFSNLYTALDTTEHGNLQT
jgi:hypothetical protein